MSPTTLSLRKLLAGVTAMASLLLTGCAAPIPVNYAPSSVKTATGSIAVGDFKYLPANPNATPPFPPNKIRNTAMGEVLIDRDVSKFVRDAVFAELRFVGVKVSETPKVVTGDIEEFLIADLGFNVDWTLRIKYSVTDRSSGQVIYTATKNTERKTAKFANAFGAINELIKINVEQLLDDTSFVKTLN